MSYSVPILLIAWRRPHEFSEVLNSLKSLAPSKLYIACDGPRPRNDQESCLVERTRSIPLDIINWTTDIKYLFQSQNLGCKLAVSTAITWFFNNESEGIILEDDCVPCEEFLLFCEHMLSRYRHDPRIWCISGSNFQGGVKRGDGDYYYSRYNHCWGWASWRRCWNHYDLSIRPWSYVLSHNLMHTLFPTKIERFYWRNVFNRLYTSNIPNTWDYQWFLTCLVNNGLTIIPNHNLITNVGFGESATHTHLVRKSTINTKPAITSLNRPPSYLIRNNSADWHTFCHHFVGSNRKLFILFLKSVLSTLNILPGY
jgi:hypothetical protein